MLRFLMHFLPFLLFLLLLLSRRIIPAQAASAIPDLSAISDSDTGNSAVAFVNTSTSPGLEGATIEVDIVDDYLNGSTQHFILYIDV